MENKILYERCNKIIWDIATSLKGVVYAKNMTFSVVRLIFLKYITDNCLKADNGDKMMNYVRVQKMFAARDNEGGQAAVYPVLQMLDESYGLNNVLTSSLMSMPRISLEQMIAGAEKIVMQHITKPLSVLLQNSIWKKNPKAIFSARRW